MEWMDRKSGKHQMIRGMHTYHSQIDSTHKIDLYLCSGSKDLTVLSVMQMTLVHETLLFSGIPPGRPPDQELVRNVSQHVAPLIDLGGMGTLGGHDTAQGVLGRLKEEGDILPISLLPTLTKHIALREDVSRMDSTIMVQGDHSMALENQKILPH